MHPATIFAPRRLLRLFGHPLLLGGALALWWTLGGGDAALPLTLAAMLALLEVLERTVPALPAWRLGVVAKLKLAGVYLVGVVASAILLAGYELLLPAALEPLRTRVGAVLWRPAGWPWLLQALVLYFASDFIFYWVHRAIHASGLLWRLSGHGFHHGFHNLHAINAGSNHPFELVVVVLPLVLLAALTGAPAEAVGAAGVLLFCNAMLAHANLDLRTPGFSALFTTSHQHRLHHSAVFEQSNRNYACAAIVWDRLFGTYAEGPVAQTGIGPRQLPLWRMYLLPFAEPGDVDTVATRAGVPHRGDGHPGGMPGRE